MGDQRHTENVQHAVKTLRRLAIELRPDAKDVVELDVTTCGRVGAMVLKRHAPAADVIRRAAGLADDLLGSRPARHTGNAATVLSALIDKVPAAQVAVRWMSDARVSIFWALDLQPKSVERLASISGFEDTGKRCEQLLRELGCTACGFALEVGDHDARRLRFYTMLPTAAAARSLAGAARRHLDVDFPRACLADPLAGAAPVVANFGAASDGTRSLKLELPGAELHALHSRIELTPDEHRCGRAAQALAREFGSVGFNYLGVRLDHHGRRQLTFYIDAHRCISRPHEDQPCSSPT